MFRRFPPCRLSLLIAAGLGLATLVSCADPETSGPGAAAGARARTLPPVKTDPEVARLVPAEFKAKKKVVFVTAGPNAPVVFFKQDNKELTGYTIDLGNAIGAAMGVQIQWKNISFDAALPGLAAGRYDAAMSSFSIEHDRLPTADFVSYYLSGGGFLIRKGSGVAVKSFDDLCGHRVSVKKGVSQLEALSHTNETCRQHGRKPVEILQLPESNAVVLALQSGRADVALDDKPQVLYAERQSSGQLCVSSVYQTSHSIAGIAVPKGSGLAKPLQAAVNSLLKSGAYERIANAWGTGNGNHSGHGTGGMQLSAKYRKLAKPWGVGADGRIRTSKIFTDPGQIKPGHSYYYQPLRKGCA